MIQGFHTAGSSMINQQKKIDIIAANVSNVSTVGYKRTGIEFEEVLYSTYNDDKSPTVKEEFNVGNGALATNLSKDFTGGVPKRTDAPLDLCIQGNGFFSVIDSNNNEYYTRGGSFKLSAELNGTYIVDNDGRYLVDQKNQKINVNNGEPTFGVDGSIAIGDQLAGKLKVTNFIFPEQLSVEGNGLYSNQMGENIATNNERGLVVQGAVEMSNVDMSTEMVELIQTQRSYQMNSRLVSVIDEMQNTANQMRR